MGTVSSSGFTSVTLEMTAVNSLSVLSVPSPADSALHSVFCNAPRVNLHRPHHGFAHSLFWLLAEDEQIFQCSRLFQNLGFDGGELSPDDVDGESIDDAIKRSDDLQKRSDSLCIILEELMESHQTEHEVDCSRADASWRRGGVQAAGMTSRDFAEAPIEKQSAIC